MRIPVGNDSGNIATLRLGPFSGGQTQVFRAMFSSCQCAVGGKGIVFGISYHCQKTASMKNGWAGLVDVINVWRNSTSGICSDRIPVLTYKTSWLFESQ